MTVPITSLAPTATPTVADPYPSPIEGRTFAPNPHTSSVEDHIPTPEVAQPADRAPLSVSVVRPKHGGAYDRAAESSPSPTRQAVGAVLSTIEQVRITN